MIKLLDILSESDYKKKDLANKNYKNYEVQILVKSKKNINRSSIEDRIRGLEGVTIVKDMSTPQLDLLGKRNKNFNYDLYLVKFITHMDPNQKIKKMIDQILHSDPGSDHHKIVGVVSAAPKLDTLEKI